VNEVLRLGWRPADLVDNLDPLGAQRSAPALDGHETASIPHARHRIGHLSRGVGRTDRRLVTRSRRLVTRTVASAARSRATHHPGRPIRHPDPRLACRDATQASRLHVGEALFGGPTHNHQLRRGAFRERSRPHAWAKPCLAGRPTMLVRTQPPEQNTSRGRPSGMELPDYPVVATLPTPWDQDGPALPLPTGSFFKFVSRTWLFFPPSFPLVFIFQYSVAELDRLARPPRLVDALDDGHHPPAINACDRRGALLANRADNVAELVGVEIGQPARAIVDRF
jgi:hypothetical protein